MHCFSCGQPVDEADQFCRHCGIPLTQKPKRMFLPRMINPQDAAGYWDNFFRPFFKMAFIFFGCFFAFALLMVVVWYFMFHH